MSVEGSEVDQRTELRKERPEVVVMVEPNVEGSMLILYQLLSAHLWGRGVLGLSRVLNERKELFLDLESFTPSLDMVSLRRLNVESSRTDPIYDSYSLARLEVVLPSPVIRKQLLLRKRSLLPMHSMIAT